MRRQDASILDELATLAVHDAQAITRLIVSIQANADARDQKKRYNKSNEGVTLRRHLDRVPPFRVVTVDDDEDHHDEHIEETIGENLTAKKETSV